MIINIHYVLSEQKHSIFYLYNNCCDTNTICGGVEYCWVFGVTLCWIFVVVSLRGCVEFGKCLERCLKYLGSITICSIIVVNSIRVP